jgi:YihY family inner membrane protein
VSTTKAVVDTAREQQVTFLAASIAYYAFVSLLPSLLLLLVVATTLAGEEIASQLVTQTQEFLTPAGADAISEAIANTPGRSGATVVGVIVLAWSTLKVFRALNTAFLTVYGQVESASFVGQLVDGAVALISIGVGVGVMIGTGTVLAALPLGPADQVVGMLTLPVVLTVVFLPIYRQFPNPPIPVREALPGALFVGIGWTLLQAGFQIYAANAGQYEAYGVIGGILLLVTWLYFAAVIVILGAVVNAVRTGESASQPPFSSKTDGSGEPTDPTATDRTSADRQLQQAGGHQSVHMPSEGSEQASTDVDAEEPTSVAEDHDRVEPRGAPDIGEIDDRVDELRAEFDAFESDVRDRTVEKPTVESDLKRYVRSKMRRGHARGWGPYLVLLYGTVMTLGAFYLFQSDWLAILAMLIIFLSTLGLYVVFVVVGLGLNLLDVPGKAIDMARDRRN